MKRFFDIKRYPGYKITTTGKVHKCNGPSTDRPVPTERSGSGQEFVFLENAKGEIFCEFIDDLLEEVFPTKHKKLSPDMNLDEWVVVAGHPKYEVNRAGQVRDVRTWEYRIERRLKGKNCPLYYLDDSPCYVNVLLYRAFGAGAAEAAGYPEPTRLIKRNKK